MMSDLNEGNDLPSAKLRELFDHVGKNQNNIADMLKEAIAIPCLSWNEKNFPEIEKMLRLCQSKLDDLGATTELVESKKIEGAEKSSNYPPILLGDLCIDEGFKTVCVYGHVDTPSTITSVEDNVATRSFKLYVENGRMRGPGISHGKGPLFAWFYALKIYRIAAIEIPVNLKFVIEGTACIQSPTLADLASRRKDFFHDVEYACLTVDKKIQEIPCLRYGYRGMCHFSLDIECGPSDIESADYGGAFDQPLFDALRVVSSLLDKHDKLNLPEIMRDVTALTLWEQEAIEKSAPDVDDMKNKIGVRRLRHKENASRLVIHNTRLPCLTVHSFETSTDYTDPRNRTLIPCRAVAKFSITLVNNQKALDTRVHVENHVKKMWSRNKAVNNYELRTDTCVDPWREDPTSVHYSAAANAIKLVYGKEPLYVCEGRSLVAASILKSTWPRCESLVLSFGISMLSDAAHAIANFREPEDPVKKEDSVSIEDYVRNVKIIMAYMCYIQEL